MTDRSLVQRRDELIEKVIDVLEPQLREKPLTTEQFLQLHELIDQHDAETLAMKV